MAEEVKKTTRTRKTTAAKDTAKAAEAEAPAEEAKQESIAELKAAYEEQIAKMKEEMATQMQAFKETLAQAQKPQIVQMAVSTEQVHFLWMAPVADDNTQDFGQGGMFGRIIGKTGEFFVPKNDLSRILDHMTRMFLDRRWLIAVSGLNEDEREALGVDYKEGELLDRKAFSKMIELGDKADEFPFDVYSATQCMYEVLKNGGLTGGFNFDSKTRRPSYTLEDMFLAYILGMDTFALGLIKAAQIIEDGRIDQFIEKKYSSFRNTEIGQKILNDKTDLKELSDYACKMGAPELPGSGRQEMLEAIVNDVLFGK